MRAVECRRLQALSVRERAAVWRVLLAVPAEAAREGWTEPEDMNEFVAASARRLGVRLSIEDKARLIAEARQEVST